MYFPSGSSIIKHDSFTSPAKIWTLSWKEKINIFGNLKSLLLRIIHFKLECIYKRCLLFLLCYTYIPLSSIQKAKTLTQLIFTCSKSTIETLKKMWNMFKVDNKITRTTSWCISHFFLVFLLLTLNKKMLAGQLKTQT